MAKSNILIVGSGVSALMLARMIRRYKNPDALITIIEREDKIGGQFGSVDYGTHGVFDYGMHIYYESCVPEIDSLFTSILPEEEWNILVGNYKDAAGLFFNGRLQTDTPYVDMRKIPEKVLGQYISDLFFNIIYNHRAELPATANAYDILSTHFGKKITDEIFVPILQKLYLNHPSQLDEIATRLTTINRVAIFENDLMLDLMKSSEIRKRICYPDQYSLPSYRENDQRGFYPKKYGMHHVLTRFKKLLEEEGVRFMTSSQIDEMELSNNAVKKIKVKSPQGDTDFDSIDQIYWTAGLPPLALALKINLSGLKNDRREPAIYVNMLLDKEPTMDLLYYFYCFDQGFRTFRVTNYTNYCPAAADGRGFPICVELWPEKGDSTDEAEVIERATSELKTFGVIDDDFRILFAKTEKVHGGGFPLPTITNIGNMNFIREAIREKNIHNIVSVGVLSEKNIFFIKDVLIDCYEKVTNTKVNL